MFSAPLVRRGNYESERRGHTVRRCHVQGHRSAGCFIFREWLHCSAAAAADHTLSSKTKKSAVRLYLIRLCPTDRPLKQLVHCLPTNICVDQLLVN